MRHEAWIEQEQEPDQDHDGGAVGWLADVGGAAAKGAVVGGLFGPAGMVVGATAGGAIAAAKHGHLPLRRRATDRDRERALPHGPGRADTHTWSDEPAPEQEAIDADATKELTHALVRLLPALIRALKAEASASTPKRLPSTSQDSDEQSEAIADEHDGDPHGDRDLAGVRAAYDDHEPADEDGDDDDDDGDPRGQHLAEVRAATRHDDDDDPVSWLVR